MALRAALARKRKLSGRAAAALCCLLAAGEGAYAADGSSPGSFELEWASRVFQSPLFGDTTNGAFALRGRQELTTGGALDVWYADGFPHYASDLGARLSGLAAGTSRVDLSLGDYWADALAPQALQPITGLALTLRGLALDVEDRRTRWRLFGGELKYYDEPPGATAEKPRLYGTSVAWKSGPNQLGFSLLSVADSARPADPTVGTGRFVVQGDYARSLSARTLLFLQGLFAGGASGGGRAGLQFEGQRGGVTGFAYTYGDSFPWLEPIYAPGVRGVRLSGRIRPSGILAVRGSLDYYSDPLTTARRDVRGDLGVGLRLGAGRPALDLVYARDEIVYDSTSVAVPGSRADRLALQATHGSTVDFYSVSLEHVSHTTAGLPDRSQGLLTLRHVLGQRSVLSATSVIQAHADDELGVTLESALERPWRGPWHWLGGLGVAWVRQDELSSGEGVARLGVGRRAIDGGWYARAELRVPFDIGLERSDLVARSLAFDFGQRFEWSEARAVGAWFRGGSAERGAIEGRVLRDGEPVRGVTILVDGAPSATTDRHGAFRVGGLPAGRSRVALDLRGIDPRYSAVGGAARDVEIRGGDRWVVDFVLAASSALQGAVVACRTDGYAPLPGVQLTLEAPGFRTTVESEVAGAFQFDGVPPGRYTLHVVAGSLPTELRAAAPTPLDLDLTADRLGFLLRIGCAPEFP